VDWWTVAWLTLMFTALTLALIRSVRRGRVRWMMYLIPFVVGLLAIRWAAYRQTWAELAAAAGIAGAICLVWWLLLGRRLPRPTDDNIRVWTNDDPF
jgi:hypothetical protein